MTRASLDVEQLRRTVEWLSEEIAWVGKYAEWAAERGLAVSSMDAEARQRMLTVALTLACDALADAEEERTR